MKIERKQEIALVKENGKLVGVLEVELVDNETLTNYKNEASKNKAIRESEMSLIDKAQNKKINAIESAISNHSLMVAKCLFNDLVEKGKATTNNDFEDMFDEFALGHAVFNKELAPLDYLRVLEKVAN